MPAHQKPIPTASLEDIYRSGLLRVLQKEYTARYSKLEPARSVLDKITNDGGDGGICVSLALNSGFEKWLNKRPWFEKMGITKSRIQAIRDTLLEWHAALHLPTDSQEWAVIALRYHHVEPEPRAHLTWGGPSPKDFIFNHWAPSHQTRSDYKTEILRNIDTYMNTVEAFYGDKTETTWYSGKGPSDRDLIWMAWSLVEGLSLGEIADRAALNGEPLVNKSTVGKSLKRIRPLLGL